MVLLAKGSLIKVIIGFTIACILSTTSALQQDLYASGPIVLSASRVPVNGGLLHIYGRNFGTDAGRIKVRIVEKNELSSTISSPAGDIVDCTNVEIVAPDTALSCQVNHVGTGKSKHIIVSTTNNNGLISSNDDDNNVAFNREVPSLQTLTYHVEDKKIVVAGFNFGYNASNVFVALDGTMYPVLEAANDAITLRLLKKRRVDEVNYQPPTSKLVHVEVDGQGNVANLSVAVAPTTNNEAVVTASKSGGMGRDTLAGIIVGGVMGFALVTLIVVLAVRNKRKRSFTKQEVAPATTDNKPEAGKVLDNVKIGVHGKASPAQMQLAMASIPAAVMQTNILSASSPPVHDDVAILTPASDATNRSLEEIDLHEDDYSAPNNNNGLYEKNIEVLSDSSFSESSSDDISDAEDDLENREGAYEDDQSFSDGDFSDASPAHSPVASPNKERRQQLQMSSEYPPAMFMPAHQQKSLRIVEANSPSPSPPTLSRTRIASSSLRNSMVIPPPLDLDEKAESWDSDGSPLPSPAYRTPSSSGSTKTSPSRKGKKGTGKRGGGGMGRGMIRVPSSRLATSSSMSSVHVNAFDSPYL